MSSKNLLQEYWQKREKKIPIYESIRKGGADHEPIFETTVVLPDGKRYHASGRNKKEADQKAAQKALAEITKDIKTKKHSPKIRYTRRSNRKKTCIVVDLENKPKIPEQLAEYLHSNVDIIAFASTEHPTLRSLRKAHLSSVQIVEVPCTRKNGADVGMTLFVGLLLDKDYELFIIVSGDSFGYCLADCIQNIDKMVNYNGTPPGAICCKTLEGVLKVL